MMRNGCRILALALTTTILLAVAGCASVDSDLPWNTPQSWEGSPAIPGLTPGDSF
jgi:hypothetical protein